MTSHKKNTAKSLSCAPEQQPKEAIIAQNGFDSRTCYKKSRSQSGSSDVTTQLGQEPGQKKKPGFIKEILKRVMSSVETDIITPYKVARPYIGPKEWFAEFSWWSKVEKKYEREKVRLGVKGLSPEQKGKYLKELCDELNKVILKRNKLYIYHEDVVNEGAEFTGISLLKCLELMKEDGDISDDRKETISNFIFNLKKFFISHPAFEDIRPAELTQDFNKLFLSYLQEKELAGKTINKYLGLISYTTEWLKIKGALHETIITKHLRVAAPKNETGKFPPLTNQEKLRAFEYYRLNYPHMHLFLFCVYYTCIRPAELHRIQAENFNFERDTIYVPWYDSKNGLSKYIQMLAPLKKELIEMGIDKLPPKTYPFGARCKPSLIEYEGHYTTDNWTRARKHMGMPTEKQLYGLKHTFNVDHVENNKYNVNWEFLRNHNRHATIQQTQEYISGLTAYFIDETKSVILDYHKSSSDL